MANVIPRVLGQGLSSCRSGARGAQECRQPHPSEAPFHPSESLRPGYCWKSQGRPGSWEQPRELGAALLLSSPRFLEQLGPDIPLFQPEPQRVILTKVRQSECQFSVDWELQDVKPEFRLNSPGYLGNVPTTRMGKCTYILKQQHLLESTQGMQQRCQVIQNLFSESFKCQQKISGLSDKGTLLRPNLRFKTKSHFFWTTGENVRAPPLAWGPATWRPHEASRPRQKCSCVSPLTWGWRKLEMKLLVLDIATQSWTSSQSKWEMPMLIKCHLNYFCQGYKKKLETSSLGHLLLIAIYKSSVCQACNMHYFPFENKKKLLKYQSAFQLAK